MRRNSAAKQVNRLALERLRYAAQLARSTRLPLLVSGGAPHRRHARSAADAACAGTGLRRAGALGGIRPARHARERRFLGGASARPRTPHPAGDPRHAHERARRPRGRGLRSCPPRPPGSVAATRKQRATRRSPSYPARTPPTRAGLPCTNCSASSPIAGRAELRENAKPSPGQAPAQSARKAGVRLSKKALMPSPKSAAPCSAQRPPPRSEAAIPVPHHAIRQPGA